MSMSAPLSDLARVTAEDLRRAHPEAISPGLAREVAMAVEVALLTAVRGERRECAAECARRSELWQQTADRPGIFEVARVEAKHRANEAQYLADLIATRAGVPA